MKTFTFNQALCCTVLAASTVLSACGGGGGGQDDKSWVAPPSVNKPSKPADKGTTGGGSGTTGGGSGTTGGGGGTTGGGGGTTGGGSGTTGGGGGTTGGGGGTTGGGSGTTGGGGGTTGGGGGTTGGGGGTTGGDSGTTGGGGGTTGGDSGTTGGGGGTTGGDSGAKVGSNTIPILVKEFSATSNNVNQPFVTVTICPPGSKDPAQCATIDRMVLDTGSIGVRVLNSAIPANLRAQFTALNASGTSSPLTECSTFGSGYIWGPIALADVLMGDKKAPAIPIQIGGDPNFPSLDVCAQRGGKNMGTPEALDANGLVGIGFSKVDTSVGYYSCPTATSCTPASVGPGTQVTHPVMAFDSDNNGTIIRLPDVPAEGAPTVTGELIFGIGTRTNNQMPASVSIVPVNTFGWTTVTYGGIARNGMFDSGTNSMMFYDGSIPISATNWYIPPKTLSLTALVTLNDGSQKSIPFSITSLDQVWTAKNHAYNNIGTRGSQHMWGLPFFFGRSVYSAVQGATVGTQAGPFTAF
ncbi:DUF3443 family protein [Paraburkholderia hayleyella]|uniref:DUF3443 family protein n=1 Tax=Paraburkholderia hayleyella TaxID=2152889 RepID=UPI0012920888|nr:DUF3443 family protein [Paraburkholderia hayleyella]